VQREWVQFSTSTGVKNTSVLISPSENGANYIRYAFENESEHVQQDTAIFYIHGGGFSTFIKERNTLVKFINKN